MIQLENKVNLMFSVLNESRNVYCVIICKCILSQPSTGHDEIEWSSLFSTQTGQYFQLCYHCTTYTV